MFSLWVIDLYAFSTGFWVWVHNSRAMSWLALHTYILKDDRPITITYEHFMNILSLSTLTLCVEVFIFIMYKSMVILNIEFS